MLLRPQALGAASVAAAAAAFALPSARAEEPGLVVVTAARAPQALADALPHTTVLTRVDIERSQSVDLVSLLAFEAGLQLSANGGRGTASSLFVRGAAQRQMLVLVDGVPLSRQDATGQVGIEHLMLDAVERIEIVRGNVSALYGSGAIGGVVQVFTRQGGVPQLALKAEAGSRGFVQASAHASGGAGATQWSFGVSGERERGQSVLDPVQVPAANPDRDGYRNTSASFNATHAIADGHKLGVGVFHTDGRLDYDRFYATPTDVQKSRNRKDLVRLSSDDRFGERWTSHLVLSRQRDDARNDESGDFGFSGRWRTTDDALNWSNELRLGRDTTLIAGLDHQRQHIEATDNFGGDYDRARTTTAVYAGATSKLGAHELALNLREDHVGGVGSHGSADVGWGYAFTADWKVFARAANAFSAPPLGYLYAPFFGNPSLRPERARSAELGLQWTAGAQRLRATLFRARVRDELDFDPRTSVFENLARTRNEGLEVSYAGRVGASDLRASLTSQDPIDDVTGQRRARRSRLLASASASHDVGHGVRVGVAARYADARVDSGGERLAAYTVADLTAQWDFRPDAQWFGRIENVGDVRYQTAFGYNQPPRGFYTGVRWHLAL